MLNVTPSTRSCLRAFSSPFLVCNDLIKVPAAAHNSTWLLSHNVLNNSFMLLIEAQPLYVVMQLNPVCIMMQLMQLPALILVGMHHPKAPCAAT